MSWWADFRKDLARVGGTDALSCLKLVLTEQGLWALLQYRIEAALCRSQLPSPIKTPFRALMIISHKLVECATGIQLPCTTQIGPGAHLPHGGFRVLHAATVIGSNCCISQGVTIGISGRGDYRGVPVIGDRVYLGANAVVVGKIKVGDGAVIGANSLVNRDVDPDCTVLGVPATVINRKGSGEYITNPLLPMDQSPGSPLKKMKLLVCARVEHYQHEGRFYSYTPYVREIDLWGDLFGEVAIAGTLRHQPPPGDCTAFSAKNVTVLAIANATGSGIALKAKQALLLPMVLWQLARYMRNADAIHARCPCDLGLLGLVMGPLFSGRLIAKYATQWLPYPGEPRSWRLQRWLLKSRWWRGPVTVYGRWPGQPDKVIPFFTSMLTQAQIEQGQRAARAARQSDLFRVLFVGRLSTAKNVDVLLRAFAQLKHPKTECVIIGEGPQRAALQALAAELGIRDKTHFTGGLAFDEVLRNYQRANALVLVSEVEGWPKAIAEAMAFGMVCIGTARGMMPQMLDEGRGILVPPHDVAALASALNWIASHPAKATAMGSNAARWAGRYSSDGLKQALFELMIKRWNLQDKASAPQRIRNSQ